MLKIIAASALGLALVSGSAVAADLAYPTKAPAYVTPVQNYDWNGFYLGVMGGGGWGRSRYDFTGVGTTTGTFGASGGFVGGTIGYNWQTAGMVLGLEGDAAKSWMRGSAACPGAGFTCQTFNDVFGTVRGRLGYAAGPWMPYITGGAAIGNIRANIPGFGGQDTTRVGWTIGAGVEWMVMQGWSIKGEYAYIDLGSMTCAIGNCSGLTDTNVRFSAHTAKVGVNYHFNWGSSGPVVARY